ncbi:MAG: hypothetical protein KF746_04500 [Chitinophagaceae bacterium]|nr:hypothetical protein [Chitinophagaceae bacterium]
MKELAHRMEDYSFFISEEDRQYAVKNFGLNPDATTVIIRGIQQHTACTQDQKKEVKKLFAYSTLLLQNNDNYTIIVCRGHLPEQYNRLEAYKDKTLFMPAL